MAAVDWLTGMSSASWVKMCMGSDSLSDSVHIAFCISLYRFETRYILRYSELGTAIHVGVNLRSQIELLKLGEFLFTYETNACPMRTCVGWIGVEEYRYNRQPIQMKISVLVSV